MFNTSWLNSTETRSLQRVPEGIIWLLLRDAPRKILEATEVVLLSIWLGSIYFYCIVPNELTHIFNYI